MAIHMNQSPYGLTQADTLNGGSLLQGVTLPVKAIVSIEDKENSSL